MLAKNRKTTIAVVIVLVGTLFGGILVVSATNQTNPIDKIGKTLSGWISTQDTNKDTEKDINDPNAAFYELAYTKATSEQKESLDKIFADTSINLPGEWRRPVLIAIGDLPKDMPRLSIEQATNLFDTKEISALESEFNKIAGAPDFVGGSGIERSIYFLNDDKSEAIILMLNDIFYIVNNADGTQTRLPISTQKLPTN
ncbi:MAG: hypothetical protein FWC74_09175, partial [Candidatus Bathyarchaeota archaeon]|nr:hypothetical protein [Candidatus Termitimicrobium sp.]